MTTEKMRVALILIGGHPVDSCGIVIGRTHYDESRGMVLVNWRTMLGLRLRGLVTMRRDTDETTVEGGWDVALTEAGARAVAR